MQQTSIFLFLMRMFQLDDSIFHEIYMKNGEVSPFRSIRNGLFWGYQGACKWDVDITRVVPLPRQSENHKVSGINHCWVQENRPVKTSENGRVFHNLEPDESQHSFTKVCPDLVVNNY